MSQFYARYIPVTKLPEASHVPAAVGEKRKRPEQPKKKEEKSRKKHKAAAGPPVSTTAVLNQDPDTEQGVPDVLPEGKEILEKYSVTESARRGGGTVDVRHRKKQDGNDATATADTEGQIKQKRKKNTVEREVLEEDAAAVEESYHRRHHAVLSKFEKATQESSNGIGGRDDAVEQDVVSDQPAPELHGLEPIPQPEEAGPVQGKPTYSTIPGWQANATQVIPGSMPAFPSLGVGQTIVENLRKHGLERAFPIQATVIPLLLDGDGKHHGDICVSAATGSGKTLAYVLPIVEALKDLATTQLRGVIVVPTRELVKQVRELCEICAAGTGLQIATAVGSKSIKEEQDILILEEEIYDPEQYQKEQQSPVDWSTFSLETLLRKAQSKDPLDSVGYMTRHRSKVDILITTPGRLVDHLRSTPGFNLDDVNWLVVDEADRLLNESYQEWIDVVVPALQSRASTQQRDSLLRHMRMEIPPRTVRKVLLSATMTRDISKLNSLGLHNPKLVVLGSSIVRPEAEFDGFLADEAEERHHADADTVFHLPLALSESAVSVKDGAEKPLYLLELLSKHMIRFTGERSEENGLLAATSQSGSSSDSDSSSDSSSDSGESEDYPSSSSGDESTSDADTLSHHSPTASRSESLPSRFRRPEERPRRPPRVLIFTRSTASATRLSRLLTLLSPPLAPQISTLTRSTASSATSRRALSSFRNGKTSILIATDRASRGLDVPGLEHVVSYDVPNSALTYVHRVGRTARAGNQGQAWTLVEHREGAWFWREIGGKGQSRKDGGNGGEMRIQRQGKIMRMNLTLTDDALKSRYEAALQQLGEEVRGK